MSRARWIGVALLLPAVVAAVGPDAVQESLRRQIERTGYPPEIRIEGELMHAFGELPRFYEERGFAPAWSRDGRPRELATELLGVLASAPAEGLRPSDYHVDRLRERLARGAGQDAVALAETDLLLTDAFLMYSAHLVGGRIDPVTVEPDWIAARQETDLVALLERVAAAGSGLTRELAALRPHHEGYRRLVAALARYRGIRDSGGWPTIPDGPTLRPGESGESVPALRRRIAVTDDLPAGDDASAVYDEQLADAVRRFQRRHGLDDDGVVGPKTRAALHLSAAERVRQIEINLERWRWLPLELGDPHVLVNIPEFRLRVVAGGAETLALDVIVGRAARRTPVFSDSIRYIVLNPTWDVPPTILRQDKLPAIRRNPDFLAENNMTVFVRAEDRWVETDPSRVDWSRAGAATVRLRQRPGPNNALGRLKFMFPNPFNVYLHDTPSRELFARTERDFSSGCIRVGRPLELAAWLLRDSPGWSREALTAAIDSGREQTVTLARPVPVHLQYWTAWTDAEGNVDFRRDLYGRDARLDAALRLPPPDELDR